MSMRSLLLGALMLVVTAAVAAARTSAPQSPPAGANQPQQTSPLPGAMPQTPGAPPAPAPSPTVVAPPAPVRVFASEQGLIFNAIRPDKVADFETVIAKLRQALETSKDPARNRQGWGWKIFKAAEPGPNGSVLYVFVMDPAVKGADYGVAKILAEAYPMEIMELYRMYSTAFATAGQTLLNLQPITGATGAPATTGSAAPAATGSDAPATAKP